LTTGPAVSVVVPTHNRRELLLRALRSVLRQQGCRFEVIVVDDGCQDGTSNAIERIGDSRIRVLRNEQAIGVASARNAGVSAARSSWIALLDDDDLWSPDKLARQLAAVENSGRAWVYAGSVEIDASGALMGGEPPLPPEELVRELPQRNVMPAGSSNVMFRASMFHQVGRFDPRLRLMADWDLWLRFSRAGLPACVFEPLVAYRMHGGQATVDPKGMLAEGRLLAERHGANLNSVRRWLAWSHLRRGERLLAARTYAETALGGDVSSIVRAAAALFHPSPTTLRRAVPGGREWSRAAESWLQALAE
jgi:glycosyltransferase involved in cell wall biosynthesis